MRKYKLLKDIPGCKVGDTIYVNEGDNEGSFIHAAGTGYVLPIKVLEDYKEYFEEISAYPKNWEDIKNLNTGYYIDNDSEIAQITRDKFKCYDKNVVPTKAHAKSMLAFAQLSMLAKAMNGDWVPDWSDSDMFKYTIVSNSKRLKITYNWRDPKLLVFKTKEMAEFSLKHHIELWEDYWMINE